MPVFDVYYDMVDSQNRKVSKEFQTKSLIGDGDQLTAASDLATDLSNLTGARVLAYTVKQRVVYADIVTAGSNRDEGITLVMLKENNFKDTIKVPAPIDGLLDGNGNVDTANAAIAAFVANFLVGGDFTFSDGEQATEVLSGTLDK